MTTTPENTATLAPLRLSYIDGLRGLFALMIAVFHFDNALVFPGAYIAVDFFFILSGFILAYVYQPRIESISAAEFVGARLARLWPLHVFTLLLFVACYASAVWLATGEVRAHPDWPGDDVYSFLRNVLLIHNLGFENFPKWNYPGWSISVEFFVNVALFFCLSALAISTRRGVALMIVAVVLAYGTLMNSLPHLESLRAVSGNIGTYFNTGLIRGVGGIFLGALVYRAVVRFQDAQFGEVKTVLELVLFSAILGIILLHGKSMLDFAAIFMFALLLGSLSIGDGSVLKQMLAARPLASLGTISYSVYLGHLPVLQFFRRWTEITGLEWSVPVLLGAYVVTVLLVATALYHLIERPGQRWFKGLWQRILRPRSCRGEEVAAE